VRWFFGLIIFKINKKSNKNLNICNRAKNGLKSDLKKYENILKACSDYPFPFSLKFGHETLSGPCSTFQGSVAALAE
jgi:hypothetical protein